jgi:hypothetical protein
VKLNEKDNLNVLCARLLTGACAASFYVPATSPLPGDPDYDPFNPPPDV